MARKDSKKITSPHKKKLLILLRAAGLFALSRSNRKNLYRLSKIPKELREVNVKYLQRLVNEFYQDRLVDIVEHQNGEISMTLSDKGERVVLRFDIDDINMPKPKEWGGSWTIVFFDIPEKNRAARDALRDKLKEIGFYELQKSALIYPYPCVDQINFIVEFFEVRPHVRYGELRNLSNEAELKLHFGLH